ncbi:MAG: transglutaminase family protein [Chthoniobacter sp.]
MNETPESPILPLELAVRIGCKLTYNSAFKASMLLNLKPRHDAYQLVAQELLDISPIQAANEFEDEHGNTTLRLNLPLGLTTLVYDAIAFVPAASEDVVHLDRPIDPEKLAPSLLRYTFPSRYCDSDKLQDFAWQKFGRYRQGVERVTAICDWIHENIEYRTGSGSPDLTAHDVIERGYGVCRDFAHCGVALCRTFNLPARYVSGYVPDIACFDPGTPMDFHAYFEVFMGGRWQVFDARFNRPRTGRVRISAGYDASSCAFSTCYGAASLGWFEVWSYQVDPAKCRVGDPIDLSKRLCGTPEIRRPNSPPMLVPVAA